MDQKKALEPWMKFDVPLSMKETEKTAVFIGSLPGGYTRESLYTELKTLSSTETFDADIVYADALQTCVFLVCEKKDASRVQEALRRMNFAAPPVSDINPAEKVKEIDRQIEESEKKLVKISERFKDLAQKRDEIRFASDYFTLRANKYGVISQLLQSSRVFFLSGFVPENRAEEVKEKLEGRFNVAVTIKEPGERAKPPVLLKNNSFAAPLESVTESYSLPGKGEIDPTFIAACFYYILFGMMLSDAAYGLIIFLATAFILKKYGKTMENGMKRTMQMFFLCGIIWQVFD
jgi:V/A-type H+-transporting ATPase subunit I